MTLSVLPRLNLPVGQSFVAYRYFLKYILGYSEIEGYNGATYTFPAATSLAVGTNGTTASADPFTFKSTSNLFSGSHIGKYLLTYNSVYASHNGLWKIIGCPDTGTLILSPSAYGPRFTTDSNISWIVVDVTAAPVNSYTVLQAPAPTGSGTNWQVKMIYANPGTAQIQFVTAPLGSFSTVSHTFPGSTFSSTVAFFNDATDISYVIADTTYFYIWSEAAAGTSVYKSVYCGSGQAFRDVDVTFVMTTQGLANLLSSGILNNIEAPTVAGIMDTYKALYPADNTTPNGSVDEYLLTNTLENPLDYRRDIIDIPVVTGVTANVSDHEIRGLMRGIHYCSTNIPYKQFINNNRTLVSLGNGLCIDWNGLIVV